MTAPELLRQGKRKLAEAGVPDAEWDAAQLLEAAGGPDYTHLPLWADKEIPETVQARFDVLLARREKREPLQQILGLTWFYGLPFAVSSAVLCPRSDTETLVETVLQTVPDKGKGLRLLDLCTGSGCIGIALAVCGAFTEVVLSDLSKDALALAEENARKNGAEHVRLAQGDLFGFSTADGKSPLKTDGFDVICCNPPYVPSEEIPLLMPEVRDHEPHLALDGGEKGLDFYKRLAQEAPERLKSGGQLFLEIGCEQGAAVSALLRENGWKDIRVIRDLAGLDRVTSCKS